MEIDEETIASALKPTPNTTNAHRSIATEPNAGMVHRASGSEEREGEGEGEGVTPESELDTGSPHPNSMMTTNPAAADFHHIDPLGGTPINNTIPTAPSASAASVDNKVGTSFSANKSIVVNEKFQDLFIAQPPKVPSNHSLEGISPVPASDSPSSALAVDDAGFYPEDEAECLPDDDYDAVNNNNVQRANSSRDDDGDGAAATSSAEGDEEYGISV